MAAPKWMMASMFTEAAMISFSFLQNMVAIAEPNTNAAANPERI